jgi:16S rRNA G966 N2-methylase RsmD
MRKRGENIRQRADYTQKYNVGNGRHGWLQLTPAYSVKVVEEIMGRYPDPVSFLDPFCGTGTTALCAVNRGNSATTIDINPFLAWLASTKTAIYSASTLAFTERAAIEAIYAVRSRGVAPAPCPPIRNIERWWNPKNLEHLRYLKAAISEASNHSEQVTDLLWVAFCRTLIKMSNASFNHQSMSFHHDEDIQLALIDDVGSMFLEDVRYITRTAERNPVGHASIVRGDAIDLTPMVGKKFDAVITSPPYANRMSYIRELRPYMYWLGYLSNGRDAGELDWNAIGGTWGIATSRLIEWSPCGNWWVPSELHSVVSDISTANAANGRLLANYVHKYFHDISHHIYNLRSLLN